MRACLHPDPQALQDWPRVQLERPQAQLGGRGREVNSPGAPGNWLVCWERSSTPHTGTHTPVMGPQAHAHTHTHSARTHLAPHLIHSNSEHCRGSHAPSIPPSLWRRKTLKKQHSLPPCSPSGIPIPTGPQPVLWSPVFLLAPHPHTAWQTLHLCQHLGPGPSPQAYLAHPSPFAWETGGKGTEPIGYTLSMQPGGPIQSWQGAKGTQAQSRSPQVVRVRMGRSREGPSSRLLCRGGGPWAGGRPCTLAMGHPSHRSAGQGLSRPGHD